VIGEPQHLGLATPERRFGATTRGRGHGSVAVVAVAVALIAGGCGGGDDGSAQPSGPQATGDLAPVPTNHVDGVGDATVRLAGTVATVSVRTSGLLQAPHAMHIHAGELGRCPPASAAKEHGGHRSISTVNGIPFYGPPVVALTTRGDTSRNSILAFRRFPSTARIRYTRSIDVGPVVAARIRNDNAVLVVHGIDYNRNGIYDFSAVDHSDLKPSLPGETTAPALCGALATAATDTTARGTGESRIYTASLQVTQARPQSLCVLSPSLAGLPPAAPARRRS
jgi:hypothetical protein